MDILSQFTLEHYYYVRLETNLPSAFSDQSRDRYDPFVSLRTSEATIYLATCAVNGTQVRDVLIAHIE